MTQHPFVVEAIAADRIRALRLDATRARLASATAHPRRRVRGNPLRGLLDAATALVRLPAAAPCTC
jgi:hypothetical protein